MKILVILLPLLASCSCTSSRAPYSEADQARSRAEITACRSEAAGDDAVLRRCLEAKGWTFADYDEGD